MFTTSPLNRPDDNIRFTPSCPPTFYNKIVPMIMIIPVMNWTNEFYRLTKRIFQNIDQSPHKKNPAQNRAWKFVHGPTIIMPRS